MGPDAATCAVITPLAAGNVELHWQLAIVMTLMMGTWCLIASRFKLGAIADLLSRPILSGLLNGVALTIIVNQISKVFGFSSPSSELIERIYALPSNLVNSHWPTVGISLLTLLCLFGVRYFLPNWPAALFTVLLTTVLTRAANLPRFGVETVSGYTGGGLPTVSWPDFKPGLLRELVIPALNLAVVNFVSMMLTARSFAAKNGYEVDVKSEFCALGLVNIVSGLSQGFAISGANSRTAVNDANGGKSQLVSVIAALAIALVVVRLSEPLQYIPIAVFGVILIYALWGLLDLGSIFQLRKRNRPAFYLALFTFLSVRLVGIIPGIGLAVLLGLLQFLQTVFRPTEHLLGVNAEGMIHSLDNGNDNDISPVDGVIMYRLNSPLTYFNVAYFKSCITDLVDSDASQLRWVVIDALASFTHADVSVLAAIDELKRELKQRGINLVLAGRRTELTRWFRMDRSDIKVHDLILVPDLYLALRLIQSKACKETDSLRADSPL